MQKRVSAKSHSSFEKEFQMFEINLSLSAEYFREMIH